MQKNEKSDDWINEVIPHPMAKDPISQQTTYYRIKKAAEILKCSADDLVHIGALGKIEILAPVLSKSSFEWPTEASPISFPSLDSPFQIKFGLTDRVILSKLDLASIEAIGEAWPDHFYYPSKSKYLIDNLEALSLDGAIHRPQKKINIHGRVIEVATILEVPKRPEPSEEEKMFREISFHSPWRRVAQDTNAARGEKISDPDPPITIDHLFISKAEIIRVIKNHPQENEVKERNAIEDEKHALKNINHFERHASAREPLWMAAIYCLTQNETRRISASDLVRKIERAADRFWPNVASIPFSKKTMEAHLSAAISGKTSTSKKSPD